MTEQIHDAQSFNGPSSSSRLMPARNKSEQHRAELMRPLGLETASHGSVFSSCFVFFCFLETLLWNRVIFGHHMIPTTAGSYHPCPLDITWKNPWSIPLASARKNCVGLQYPRQLKWGVEKRQHILHCIGWWSFNDIQSWIPRWFIFCPNCVEPAEAKPEVECRQSSTPLCKLTIWCWKKKAEPWLVKSSWGKQEVPPRPIILYLVLLFPHPL